MISVDMARTVVGRTTIECWVRWCATRCAGSDTAEMTSAESWTSARPACSWCVQGGVQLDSYYDWRLKYKHVSQLTLYLRTVSADSMAFSRPFSCVLFHFNHWSGVVGHGGSSTRYSWSAALIYSGDGQLTTDDSRSVVRGHNRRASSNEKCRTGRCRTHWVYCFQLW